MYSKLKTGSVLFSILLICALLAGCSGSLFPDPTPTPAPFAQEKVSTDVTDISLVLQSGETALLDSLPTLRTADFSGSECIEEICAWAEAHPEVAVTYTVPLPTGETVKNDVKSIDLSKLSGQDAAEAARCISCLPKLSLVTLGAERSDLTWEDIKLLVDARADVDYDFSFTLYGKSLHLADTRLDLSHITIDDGGALLRRIVACMPKLGTLDMDSCGVSDADMAAIRDQFPDTKVIWRIWFGDAYSVRTDVKRILASMPSKGGMLSPGNYDSLQYCTEVEYIDVGHNDLMTDISFISHMPKLKVAILAMAEWSDASALASCPELEYLELQTTKLKDLSPLSALTKLRHLNICYCTELDDISPLYSLKELERLWIGCMDPVPAEQIEKMQAAAPNCEINTTAYDPTEGRWRYVDYNELAYFFITHPRYEQLLDEFDRYESGAFSFYWNDPLY